MEFLLFSTLGSAKDKESKNIGTYRYNSQIPLAMLPTAFNRISQTVNIFDEIEKDEERVESAKRKVNSSFRLYRNLYEENKLL